METINPIEKEIDHVLQALSILSPESEEYTAAAENLRVLCEARTKRPARAVEPETILMAATNIVGILLILYYERFNVISSRALSLIIRR